MPLVKLAFTIVITLTISSCSTPEGSYRISYGGLINRTEVRDVWSHKFIEPNCIEYSYGRTKEKAKTEMYCGNRIEIFKE